MDFFNDNNSLFQDEGTSQICSIVTEIKTTDKDKAEDRKLIDPDNLPIWSCFLMSPFR